ncbi:hypothetical protein QIH77_03350 [Bradyrhizobium diazoefficiens]|nr:hypothetical protein [Bradyrhizobium diazoefficiens]WLA74284.1 hypothetical protein QIH77_03350 [Bradyrhizobium diazoefficiens]
MKTTKLSDAFHKIETAFPDRKVRYHVIAGRGEATFVPVASDGETLPITIGIRDNGTFIHDDFDERLARATATE